MLHIFKRILKKFSQNNPEKNIENQSFSHQFSKGLLFYCYIMHAQCIHMEITTIQHKIIEVRGQKVILDFDLAELYEVETKVLKQAIKRNIVRFPPDFMFQITPEEMKILRSQIVTSSWGGHRYLRNGRSNVCYSK